MSSWVYLTLGVIAALIALGAVAINTAINHNAISVNTALNEANTQLTLAQLDSRLLPPTIRFAKVSDDILENNPKLKEVLREVDIKYRHITEKCPPMRPVYCDIASNTRSATILTHKEFESLKRTFEFTPVEYSDGRLVWQSL